MANPCKCFIFYHIFIIAAISGHPGNYGSVLVHRTTARRDVNDDVAALKSAINESHINTDVFTEILTQRKLDQRREIAQIFYNNYKVNFEEYLNPELHGYYGNLIEALMTPLHVYYMQELRNAMWGFLILENVETEVTHKKFENDKKTIIGILCAMTNDEARAIVASYQQLYNASLYRDLTENIPSNNLKSLVVALLQGKRQNDSGIDENQALTDLESLYNETGMGNPWAIKEHQFIRVFAETSYEQLGQIIHEHERKFAGSIESVIKTAFSGSMKDILLGIAKFARCKKQYFAERLHASINESGYDYGTLIRIIVFRSEIDLADIAQLFFVSYGESLVSWITTSADEPAFHVNKALISLVSTFTA